MNAHMQVTAISALDKIEGAVVDYMSGRRGIDEAAMRKLLDHDADVRASYQCKIKREIAGIVRRGYSPELFRPY